jgi:hypothetical protein
MAVSSGYFLRLAGPLAGRVFHYAIRDTARKRAG